MMKGQHGHSQEDKGGVTVDKGHIVLLVHRVVLELAALKWR